jgi:hypothetical protein
MLKTTITTLETKKITLPSPFESFYILAIPSEHYTDEEKWYDFFLACNRYAPIDFICGMKAEKDDDFIFSTGYLHPFITDYIDNYCYE